MNSLIFLSFFIFISKSNCCIRTQSTTAIVDETCDMDIDNTDDDQTSLGTTSFSNSGDLTISCYDTSNSYYVVFNNHLMDLCRDVTLTCIGTSWKYDESESVTSYYCSSVPCP